MAVDMRGRHLVSLHDFTAEEVRQVLATGHLMKLRWKAGETYAPLRGKTLGMIFQKSSTRTRISFEVGMFQLGGHALFLSANDLQLKRGETIADTARVLSRYVQGIMIRAYDHQDVVDLATHSSVPVINGLSDHLHPCQALADLMTLEEKFGRLAGLQLVYVGDGNNVAHSLLYGCAKTGVNIAVASPPGYTPDPGVVERARADAEATGAKIEVVTDPREVLPRAHAIYTDVWVSMGQDAERERRLRDLQPYQVNAALMAGARPDAIFLHCLPAHRGEEVTDDVIDSKRSAVLDEAENRLHVQKAVLALVM
ncbi:MAG: ornithine carbamoyltransferase [Bacillota bacterium]